MNPVPIEPTPAETLARFAKGLEQALTNVSTAGERLAAAVKTLQGLPIPKALPGVAPLVSASLQMPTTPTFPTWAYNPPVNSPAGLVAQQVAKQLIGGQIILDGATLRLSINRAQAAAKTFGKDLE